MLEAREEATVGWCPGGDRLDEEIFDAMTEFVTQLMQRGERLAERFDVPMSCMKAIRKLDPAVTMKDLGLLLHCDPSFVTMIADALEQRGLAKREPNPADRRIKNLVLTSRGQEVKATIEQETHRDMPWTRALTVDEREQFLVLVRKMNDALAGGSGGSSLGADPATKPAAGEVNASTTLPLIS